MWMESHFHVSFNNKDNNKMHLIMYSYKLSFLHIQATVLPSSFLVCHPFSCNLASFFRILFIKPRNKTAQRALISEPHWLIILVTDFSCNEGIATTQLKQWAVYSFTHAFGVFKHSWPFPLVGFFGYTFYLIWNFICFLFTSIFIIPSLIIITSMTSSTSQNLNTISLLVTVK